MRSATIYTCCDPEDSAQDIVIIAQGQDAMNGASFLCFDGSTCYLYCYGDSCLAMKDYLCYDDAVCNCDGEGCPEIVTVSTKEGVDELMAFHGVGMIEDEDSLISGILSLDKMSGSMLLLVGSLSVMMIMMAMDYIIRRSEKREYEPLE